MKSVKALLFLFLLFTYLTPVSADAKYWDDSTSISPEILEVLPLEEGDQVVQMYNVDIHVAFATYNSIEELLNSLENQIFYAVKSSAGDYSAYKVINGECVKMRDEEWVYYRMDVYLKNEVMMEVDPSIEIKQMYYLMGEAGHTGTAIYYKTNLGDYVYYFSISKIFNGNYIFNADAFLRFKKQSLLRKMIST